MAIYGYCRISTKKQTEGYGLESQKKEILEKYEDVKIFQEQFTGSTKDRPVFNLLLSKLKTKDMLVVSKLDRLARNTVEGIQIVEDLFSKNVSVHVLNIGLLENTNMGKFFLTTLLAVAEMERNTIIERTQAGKLIAKLNPNFKDGRPKKYGKDKLDFAIETLKTKSYKEIERTLGISKSTLWRELKLRGLTKEDLINE